MHAIQHLLLHLCNLPHLAILVPHAVFKTSLMDTTGVMHKTLKTALMHMPTLLLLHNIAVCLCFCTCVGADWQFITMDAQHH